MQWTVEEEEEGVECRREGEVYMVKRSVRRVTKKSKLQVITIRPLQGSGR